MVYAAQDDKREKDQYVETPRRHQGGHGHQEEVRYAAEGFGG
jgi:hypothetical protein